MKQKIELSNQQIEILQLGNRFKNKEGEEYFHIPTIFKKVGDYEFEEYSFSELPEGLKKYFINNFFKEQKDYLTNV